MSYYSRLARNNMHLPLGRLNLINIVPSDVDQFYKITHIFNSSISTLILPRELYNLNKATTLFLCGQKVSSRIINFAELEVADFSPRQFDHNIIYSEEYLKSLVLLLIKFKKLQKFYFGPFNRTSNLEKYCKNNIITLRIVTDPRLISIIYVNHN